MPRFRVLHLLASAQRDWTGIARIIANAIPGLRERGFDADVVFLDERGPLVELFSHAGVGVATARWSRRATDPAGVLRAWRALGTKSHDIVHSHVGGRLLLGVARRATGAPVLLQLHSRVREADGGFHPVSLETAGADGVVAVSEAVAAAAVGAHPTVVYPGVVVPPIISTRARGNPIVIGATGRLEKGKGYADLIRAFAALSPAVQLQIAGEGPQRGELVDLARSLGLADRVHFLGWIEDLSPLRAAWTAFAHPSYDEGNSVAIIEAMAAGLPIVASAVGGVREAIIDGESGVLVPPGDPQRLAAALTRVLNDEVLARALGNHARERAIRHFSIEQQVLGLERAYRALLP